VIRAAAHAFNRKGYHNTSLDDIAAALDVTKPTVYYYVTNKEQLLFECFVAGVEQIRAAFREVKQLNVTGRERLNGVLRHYGAAVASEFGWCMVRAEEQDLSPAMSGHIKTLKSEIDQGIRRLIREGVQDGSIHPCDPKMTAPIPSLPYSKTGCARVPSLQAPRAVPPHAGPPPRGLAVRNSRRGSSCQMSLSSPPNALPSAPSRARSLR
jgi:AcrR family transcriptional regulator